jgi:hypothetical protein
MYLNLKDALQQRNAIGRRSAEPLFTAPPLSASRAFKKPPTSERGRAGSRWLRLRPSPQDELMKCATNVKHLISPMFRPRAKPSSPAKDKRARKDIRKPSHPALSFRR